MGLLADNHSVTAAHGDGVNLTTSGDFEDELAAYLRQGERRGNFYHLAPTIREKSFSPIPFEYEWNPEKGKYEKDTNFRWKQFQTKLMTEAQLNRVRGKHGDAPLVAIPTGEFSGITVVDVDGDAEDIDFAIDTFGETDVMVQTASFGVHLYYGYNGEKNSTKFLGRPIDIRGHGGCIIVPGSFLDGEFYQFIAGGWDDFEALKYANPLDAKHETQPTEAHFMGEILEGRRDKELFDHGRNIIGSFLPSINDKDAAQMEALMSKALNKFTEHLVQWNQNNCNPPLPEKEIIDKAKYLWERKRKWSLFEDGRRVIGIPAEDLYTKLAIIDPRAFSLMFQLREQFKSYKPFTLPQSRGKEFGLSPKTFGEKMQVLVQWGVLTLLHQGGGFSTRKYGC